MCNRKMEKTVRGCLFFFIFLLHAFNSTCWLLIIYLKKSGYFWSTARLFFMALAFVWKRSPFFIRSLLFLTFFFNENPRFILVQRSSFYQVYPTLWSGLFQFGIFHKFHEQAASLINYASCLHSVPFPRSI